MTINPYGMNAWIGAAMPFASYHTAKENAETANAWTGLTAE